MLVLDARKSARLTIGKHGSRPTPSEPTPAPAAVVPDVNLSALDYLTAKNPALTALVAALDLAEVGATSRPALSSEQPEPLPPLPRVNYEPANPRLRIIANRTFAPCTSYAPDEALTRLATKTNVTPERAANGLEMMLRQNIIATDLSGCYYLSESTPF